MKQYNKNLLTALIRQDFGSFINKVFTTINPGAEYSKNWHIDLIAEYLELVEQRKIKRLIINMPPRALKSVCVSVAWPAWLLAKNPATRIMSASYSHVLSIKHSMDCRFVLASEWYQKAFPKTKLSRKHNQKSKFMTTENGFRFATSVGGSATGEGGDFLIIDDPHNPTQINSSKFRKRVHEWFDQTFVSRLNDQKNGAIVLVMQRLHNDDLTSHLLASGAWEHLKIPAIASEDICYQAKSKYHFQSGKLLNNQRDSAEYLERLQNQTDPKAFAAQYMQEPVPENYNILSLEDISYWDKLPEKFDYYILSWDTAIKVSENADYSVCTCYGIKENQIFLVAMERAKVSYPDLKQMAEKLIKRYFPRYVLIEDKASGQSLIQDLKNNGAENIIAIKPKLDKITRFAAVVSLFQAAQILLPLKSSFNKVLLNELTNFPTSKNDDIVDSVSQMLEFFKNTKNNRKVRIRIF